VTFAVSSEATGNWESTTGENWTIPLIFNVSKVTRLGPFPFSLGGGFGVFVTTPEGGPEWKLRMIGTLILPRSHEPRPCEPLGAANDPFAHSL
jgi:hypothetical protein